ncbi:MAG: DUF559 domain-containing protein [Actinobacteria bacterium]|nr:DUF559 domain-containing protein [Actinomycetota bacterium]
MPVKCCYCGQSHTLAVEVRACAEAAGFVTAEYRTRRGSSYGPAPRDRNEKLSLRELMLRFPTDPEERLWRRLDKKQVDGFKFHRQYLIRGWIVDFYCPAGRLIVEVDGTSHLARRSEDRSRDEILRAWRYRTLRISAARVYRDLDGVVKEIRQVLDHPAARRRRDRYRRSAQARTV